MRKILHLILVMALVASCVGNKRERSLLDAAQSLVNQHPDSALALLDSLSPSVHRLSRNSLRRWQLLRLMAANKCDTVFRSDSLQQVLVDYYDSHGTPNEKMWAHYLLGRAWSDLGESPKAMKAFLDAVNNADTLSAECDWWNLSRLSLQLAHEYYLCDMPLEMQGALQRSHSAALHAGDTTTAIIAFARQWEVYELMGKKDSLSATIKEAAVMFQRHGRDDLASQMLSVLIEDEVEKGHLDEARRMIKYYEGSSGFFGSNHEIGYGKEIYYFSKGIYYLGSGQADSAEWTFRKLLHNAKDINDKHAAYLGLTKKYASTGPKDSLVKYALLSESSNDSLYQETYQFNYQMLQKRYNYSRHLEKEKELMQAGERKDKMLMTIFFTFITIAVGAVAFHIVKKREMKAELHEYGENLKRISKLKSDLEMLANSKELTIVRLSDESVNKQADIEQLKQQVKEMAEKADEAHRLASEAEAEKDKEIRQLVSRNKELEQHVANKTRDSVIRKIRKSDIVHNFTLCLTHPLHHPTTEEWNELDLLFLEVHPNFQSKLQGEHQLSEKEYKVCQLVLAGFSPKDIATLMDIDNSYTTTLRKRLLTKVTGKSGKAKEFDEYLFSIPIVG